ncbi:hypothetical protein EW026_g598 [Hermanssonia centrifuga]|uniref:Terpene synthase n=1 Tax=Hermanssonia centrifuga TaxID=98765 RepID=A0A4S4KU76_9APHY|nr:hypothetical protein EW026_g598 [Hermanssonia centrifuga]
MVVEIPPSKNLEYISIPNLTTEIPYPLRCNPHTKTVSNASNEWFLGIANLSSSQESQFHGLNAGRLCGTCYVDCSSEQLRVVADFLSFFFCLDDWTDEFDTAGTKGLADCVMNALYHPYTHSADTVVFRVTKDGAKACFALEEYALQIDLPDEVVNHRVIRDLEDAANDAISWYNDILSYNVEQARGDTHNLVVILMNDLGLDRQAAIDHATELAKHTSVRFETCRSQLPSWGQDVDGMVAKYVQALQDWMVGSCHWSFDTERYFGKDGAGVKKSLRVPLLPKRAVQ